MFEHVPCSLVRVPEDPRDPYTHLETADNEGRWLFSTPDRAFKFESQGIALKTLALALEVRARRIPGLLKCVRHDSMGPPTVLWTWSDHA